MKPRVVALLMASAVASVASEGARRANSYLSVGLSDDRDLAQRVALEAASASLREVATVLHKRAEMES